MGTFSNNKTVYIVSAVNYSNSFSASAGVVLRNRTIFSTIANQYAIVNVYFGDISANLKYLLGTSSIGSGADPNSANSLYYGSGGSSLTTQIYLGPSTTLYWGAGGAVATAFCAATGVIFQNSP